MAFDPDVVYNQTAADLQLQAGWEEGNLDESLHNLQANEGYQESEISRNEPGVYRGASNAANRGGLLTSGINTRRKGDIAANFAARRTANQLALRQGENRITREREGGQLRRAEKQHGAETTRAAERDRIARENPLAVAPYTPPGTPTIPAGTRPPLGMEFNNGLTVPIGTRTIRPYAERRVRK